MIITANGKNVYVDEIEKLLLDNPAIKSAAVFEEDYHVAARVYTDLSSDGAQKIVDEINSKLPKFKRIHNLYVKADIPGGRLK